jgi:ABC-type glutathione transport system ATPase component
MGGTDDLVQDRYFTGTVTNSVSSEEVLISFQSVSTFQSETNRVVAEGVRVSISTDGNKNAQVKMYKNLSISGASWANVDATNSIMQTDTAGTITPDDANLLWEYNLAKNDSIIDDIRDIDFILYPGETITITGQSGAANEITFTARWREKF